LVTFPHDTLEQVAALVTLILVVELQVEIEAGRGKTAGFVLCLSLQATHLHAREGLKQIERFAVNEVATTVVTTAKDEHAVVLEYIWLAGSLSHTMDRRRWIGTHPVNPVTLKDLGK
jgi:mannitol/fructose-specific phosphotransferase system IIA component